MPQTETVRALNLTGLHQWGRIDYKLWFEKCLHWDNTAFHSNQRKNPWIKPWTDIQLIIRWCWSLSKPWIDQTLTWDVFCGSNPGVIRSQISIATVEQRLQCCSEFWQKFLETASFYEKPMHGSFCWRPPLKDLTTFQRRVRDCRYCRCICALCGSFHFWLFDCRVCTVTSFYCGKFPILYWSIIQGLGSSLVYHLQRSVQIRVV